MKSPVRTCRQIARTAECAKIMAEHDICFLPVVDASGKLLGAVTDRDLAIRVLAKDRSGLTSVANAMTTDVVTCAPHDDLALAEQRLAEAKGDHIVVVDDDGTVLGVLSRSEIGRIEPFTPLPYHRTRRITPSP